MKKDNDKLAYYLPIMISLGVGAAGILSLFSIKKILRKEDFFIIRL